MDTHTEDRAMDSSFHRLYGSHAFEQDEAGPLARPALTRQNSFTEHDTIIHAASYNAKKYPNKVILQWVNHTCKVVDSITYQQLWDRATAVAVMLQSKGVQKGDRVMISYPPGLEFMVGLVGCMLAGAIACSVYPPNLTDSTKAKYSIQQFRNQVTDAGAKYALTTSEFRMLVKLRALGRYGTSITWLVTDTICPPDESIDLQLPSPNDIALIQYSSGSTCTPKGIVLTHKAIVHNVCAICRISADMTNDCCHGVNWMPQYHDYGLFNFFFPAVYTSVWSATCASPVDFIRNPLMWADMMEIYKATHTAGPNFAYGLLAKRMKTANRTLTQETQCRFVRANIAAEPIAPKTIEEMVRVIGFPRGAINPTYGLAESCVYVTSCLGPEVRIVDGIVSCGMLERTKHFGKGLVIVDDTEKGTIAPDGQVGEIHIQGPDLAAGYWNKPDLDHLFHKKLSDGLEYMGTGDLGKVVDGRLYVVGRVKELIIQNGRNVYPTDLERTVEEAYPNLVRPGSTVAFEWSDSSVCLVVEIREEAVRSLDEMSDHALQALLRAAHGVNLAVIYLLKKGSVPKTTSGKVKRVKTKQDTFEGAWNKRSGCVIRKWSLKGPSPGVESHTPAIPHDLPSDKLPVSAHQVVSRIQFNAEKVEGLFRELHLHEIDELAEAWAAADKSHRAFQSMCHDSLAAIEANLPSLVQFCHLLQQDSERLVEDDPVSLLSDISHAGFVMQWATTVLANDTSLLQKQVMHEREIEQSLTQDLNRTPVPNEGLFLAKGERFDPLFGALDSFGWIKHKSVQHMMDQMLGVISGEIDASNIDFVDGVDYGSMNILEAVWIDRIFRRLDNASVGSWLALRGRPESTQVVDGQFQQVLVHDQWTQVYKVWNLAFSATLPETKWVLAKLLMPCVAGVPPKCFTLYRMISLHMTSHHWVRAQLSGKVTASAITKEGQLALGTLNQRWVQGLGMDERDWKDTTSQPPEIVSHWSATFQQIDSARRSIAASRFLQEAEPKSSDMDEVDTMFHSLMGKSVNMSQSWEENGLTSLMHAELTNTVAEKFSVNLPPTFPVVFKTPRELKAFILGNAKLPFPVNLPSLEESCLSKHRDPISSIEFHIVSSVGILLLLAALLGSFIVTALLSTRMGNYQISSQVENGPLTFELHLLPMTIPAFALTFSLVVVAMKWIVVGHYKSTEMVTPSVGYLQWWLVDRAVHAWEFLIGRFLVGTKFAWLFYYLMGARIHPSARLNTFIREFDLVTVGPEASVSHPIRCRKFGPWLDDAPGPTIRLRPVVIGKGSNIRGMVSPGAKIGDGARVEPLSVVQEGGQVPNNIIAQGNPACGSGNTEAVSFAKIPEAVFELAKIVLLFVELYIFYAVVATSWNLWRDLIPSSFRYHVLVQVILLIPTSTAVLVLISVIMKWLLIGHRTGGSPGTTWSRIVDWFCNFHYRTSCFFLYSLTGGSRLWNLVLKLHGLDVDYYSYLVDPLSIGPSQVDCIQISHSFISAAPTFETGSSSSSPSKDNKIEIVNSSIAAQVIIAPGTKVVRSTVRPMVHLEESLYDHNPVLVTPQPGVWLLELFYLLSLPTIGITVIPCFELANVLKLSAWTLPFGALLLIILQCLIWLLVLRLLQWLANTLRANKAPTWLSHPVYTIYLNTTWTVSSYCFWNLLWGTPWMGPFLRYGLGARVLGRLWYNGSSLHDFARLTFQDRTVLDTCAVSSHYQIFGELFVSPTYVAGLLHPGTYAQGRSVLQSDQEYGPCRTTVAATTALDLYDDSKENGSSTDVGTCDATSTKNLVFDA